jgi:hypothetical protein
LTAQAATAKSEEFQKAEGTAKRAAELVSELRTVVDRAKGATDQTVVAQLNASIKSMYEQLDSLVSAKGSDGKAFLNGPLLDVPISGGEYSINIKTQGVLLSNTKADGNAKLISSLCGASFAGKPIADLTDAALKAAAPDAADTPGAKVRTLLLTLTQTGGGDKYSEGGGLTGAATAAGDAMAAMAATVGDFLSVVQRNASSTSWTDKEIQDALKAVAGKWKGEAGAGVNDAAKFEALGDKAGDFLKDATGASKKAPDAGATEILEAFDQIYACAFHRNENHHKDGSKLGARAAHPMPKAALPTKGGNCAGFCDAVTTFLGEVEFTTAIKDSREVTVALPSSLVSLLSAGGGIKQKGELETLDGALKNAEQKLTGAAVEFASVARRLTTLATCLNFAAEKNDKIVEVLLNGDQGELSADATQAQITDEAARNGLAFAIRLALTTQRQMGDLMRAQQQALA